MLNISENSVSKYILPKAYRTLSEVEKKHSSRVLRKIIIGFTVISFVVLFLPWTQNVRSEGYITTLKPDQRPQSLNSIIGGRIDNWYVKEGDYVNKGDTILKISEIKDAYFDDELLQRTKNQIELKEESVKAYGDKIAIQTNQLDLLQKQMNLKLTQAKNKLGQAILKVQNDSINFESAKLNYTTASAQYDRADSLYAIGLKSKIDLEKRRVKKQETKSYELAAKNKYLNSQNEVLNLKVELSNIEVKFQSDYNKIESERFSTVSRKLDTETNINKLKNQYSNYQFRNGLYFITAPQDGYITKTFISGIGEVIKEGQQILTLMPKHYDLAVELYVKPIDLPLIKKGEHVNIQFDGWPAIVFSGWPSASYGTFQGKIYAIDQFISANGKYRVLVREDSTDHCWPDDLRFGSGATNLMLLKDVPVWYELWRNINGFPPEYYEVKEEEAKNLKKK
ncbi:MAG: HlyD family secretion protein [Flavobacteriales bacterium]|jgi:multidrug resistance efflux pump|nr:HlyD family secretion protein [Flavobacteriales bacterium]